MKKIKNVMKLLLFAVVLFSMTTIVVEAASFSFAFRGWSQVKSKQFELKSGNTYQFVTTGEILIDPATKEHDITTYTELWWERWYGNKQLNCIYEDYNGIKNTSKTKYKTVKMSQMKFNHYIDTTSDKFSLRNSAVYATNAYGFTGKTTYKKK
ncbi:MAG: hypothetical protein HFJ09_04205 [Lachnospiraceae bacterium]|nr:hypothetical protein [Lachnospiraceae bacterium]